MSAFIINAKQSKVVGFVQNAAIAATIAGDNLVIGSATDLEVLSLQELTDLYNAYTSGAKVGKFKIAKPAAAERVYKALSEVDQTTLTQLDNEEEVVVETQAQVVASKEASAPVLDANGKKVRKVRDSKLQRMKNAFLAKNEDGTYKSWSVKELMEAAGTTDRITHVYISILRSRSDRFVMDIDKNAETGLYQYNPKSAPQVDAEVQAGAEQPAA